MRLLQQSDSGQVSFTKDFVGNDRIPVYAILSHTWGLDTDEVTFDDVINGTGRQKPGYKKIEFCAHQAREDGLNYYWIDTCCINKSNFTELSQAINSMFRWYRDAARCYVYLPDVSSATLKTHELDQQQWKSEFQRSRWFQRGWTLQELLAPNSVEFFSREREPLGDKRSLLQIIHEITGITNAALQGRYLSQFDVDERLAWIARRQTKLQEDKAYSLLGIFDVTMPLIYGEGEESAFNRLREEIDRRSKGVLQGSIVVQRGKGAQECIQDLRLTDPRDDKKRIEANNGGLLEDACLWILENTEFKQWRSSSQSRLLWIRGDAGTGKTMLLCGIANELKKSKTDYLSYFFCQAAESRLDNASAVIRGLIYLLIDQQPGLISHLQKKYDHAGKSLFEDVNSWVALSEIFTNMLQDPGFKRTYFVIDAIDECNDGLQRLLDFIVQQSSMSSRAKWIISSRDHADIDERLEMIEDNTSLCLDLNPKSVSVAVDIYVRHRLGQLARRKRYNDATRDAVLRYLSSSASGIFLRVAVICRNLERISGRNTLMKLKVFPYGLESVCAQMIEQAGNSEIPDLLCVDFNNKVDDNLEVHLLSGANNYKTALLQAKAPLGQIQAKGNFVFAIADFNHSGTPDLYCLKRNKTGTNSVEVHILNASNNYRSFKLQVGTPVREVGSENFYFAMGDFNGNGIPDIYCLKHTDTGTGTLEVHILNGAGRYQSFLLQIGTPISLADATSSLFAVGDYNHDGKPDLYCLKRSTETRGMEVDILSGASRYQSFLRTGMPVTDGDVANFLFAVGDFHHSGFPGLCYVPRPNSRTNVLEVN